jgi:hypothetical protein
MNSDHPTAPRLSPGPTRFPYIALVLGLMITGVWAGLHRLGWPFADISEHIANQHGPLMISGFIGSLIALERAVALTIFDRQSPGRLRRLLQWLIPACSTIGSLLLLWPTTSAAGRWMVASASLGLLAIMLRIFDISSNLFTLLMALGAGGWAFGNLLWLGDFHYSTLLPAWAMFVVLTIAGERFELDRIRRVGQWMLLAFYTGVGLVLTGALVVPFNSNLAVRTSGLGALILALWLLKHDIARNSIRMKGLSRYAAIAVMVSFGWLGLYGILALRFGFVPAGPIYDAIVHSLFLGFAGGMIVAHAPIILPALLDRRAIFHPWLMVPALGLHVSIALRVVSDLAGWHTLRQWGGLLNAVTGLFFILLLAYTLWSTRNKK